MALSPVLQVQRQLRRGSAALQFDGNFLQLDVRTALGRLSQQQFFPAARRTSELCPKTAAFTSIAGRGAQRSGRPSELGEPSKTSLSLPSSLGVCLGNVGQLRSSQSTSGSQVRQNQAPGTPPSASDLLFRTLDYRPFPPRIFIRHGQPLVFPSPSFARSVSSSSQPSGRYLLQGLSGLSSTRYAVQDDRIDLKSNKPAAARISGKGCQGPPWPGTCRLRRTSRLCWRRFLGWRRDGLPGADRPQPHFRGATCNPPRARHQQHCQATTGVCRCTG